MAQFGYGKGYGRSYGARNIEADSNVTFDEILSASSASAPSGLGSEGILDPIEGEASAYVVVALSAAASFDPIADVAEVTVFSSFAILDSNASFDEVSGSSTAFSPAGLTQDATFDPITDTGAGYVRVKVVQEATFGEITDVASAFAPAGLQSDSSFDPISDTSVARAPAGLASTAVFESIIGESSGSSPATLRSTTSFDAITDKAEGYVIAKVAQEATFDAITDKAVARAPATLGSQITFDEIVDKAVARAPAGLGSAATFDAISDKGTIKAIAGAVSAATFGEIVDQAIAIVIGDPVNIILPGDARPINFTPNWKSSVQVNREFKTDIFTSRSNKEQRRALRLTARKSISLSSLLKAGERAGISAFIQGWQDRRFVLPEYGSGVPLAAAMEAHRGSAILGVGNVPRWVQPGSLVMLVNGKLAEYRYVIKVENDRIHFATGSKTPWPLGTYVCPGLMGRFPTDLSSKRYTSNVEDFNVDFTVDPTSERFYNPGPPPRTYRGVEFFARRPNWETAPAANHLAAVDVLDFGIGATDYFPLSEFRNLKLRFSHLLRNAQEIDELVNFYVRVRGRLNTFFTPTWMRDFEIGDPFSAGATSFFAYSPYIAQYLVGEVAHKDIVFVTTDRQLLPRRITDMSGGGDFSRVDIDEALPVGSNQIAMVCFLPRCRLDGDTLSLEYHAVHRAEADITIRTLESDQ